MDNACKNVKTREGRVGEVSITHLVLSWISLHEVDAEREKTKALCLYGNPCLNYLRLWLPGNGNGTINLRDKSLAGEGRGGEVAGDILTHKGLAIYHCSPVRPPLNFGLITIRFILVVCIDILHLYPQPLRGIRKPRSQGFSCSRPLGWARRGPSPRSPQGAVRRETLGTRFIWLQEIMGAVFIKTNVQFKMTITTPMIPCWHLSQRKLGIPKMRQQDLSVDLLSFCRRFQSVHWSRNTMTCPAFYSALIQSVTKTTVSFMSLNFGLKSLAVSPLNVAVTSQRFNRLRYSFVTIPIKASKQYFHMVQRGSRWFSFGQWGQRQL